MDDDWLNQTDHMTLVKISSELHPPSAACLAWMIEHGEDPAMPVFRAEVTAEAMLRTRAIRPDVANILQLMVGPFGIVSPPGYASFRVAKFKVGDVVLDVEAEIYE